MKLVQVMQRHGVTKMIFSSSATVYSEPGPDDLPLTEKSPTGNCTCPYARYGPNIFCQCHFYGRPSIVEYEQGRPIYCESHLSHLLKTQNLWWPKLDGLSQVTFCNGIYSYMTQIQMIDCNAVRHSCTVLRKSCKKNCSITRYASPRLCTAPFS